MAHTSHVLIKQNEIHIGEHKRAQEYHSEVPVLQITGLGLQCDGLVLEQGLQPALAWSKSCKRFLVG